MTDRIRSIFHSVPHEILIAGLILLGVLVIYLMFQYWLKKWLMQTNDKFRKIKLPLNSLLGPVRILFPICCLFILVPFISESDNTKSMFNHILTIGLIIGIAWLILRIFGLFKFLILNRYNIDTKDNLKARQISTQLAVIQRVFSAIIFILAASTILMTFDKVRQIGFSILASAGIAGIIIGLAAQRSLGTLIAGIQIAISQPIRIDDVVVIENEWGRIEEITLTYAVVRIWDQRRLIVPISYFIEKPFQNWTRTSAELLGTVYIYTDYMVPVDELREELLKIVKATPVWDKRIAKIQVTGSSEKTMELRALISAENSSDAWELRCLVREKLIHFMQEKYPDRLPVVRLQQTGKNHTRKV